MVGRRTNQTKKQSLVMFSTHIEIGDLINPFGYGYPPNVTLKVFGFTSDKTRVITEKKLPNGKTSLLESWDIDKVKKV